MDPGLGLIVNSIVPSEAEVPKLPPKSSLQLPDGFLEKPHVRHALKYMSDDEQREKALEIAMTWKKKFAAEKWKPVVAAIETVRQEDNIRSPPYDADLHHVRATARPAERPRAMTAASAPAVPQATFQPMPTRTELTRQHTATASLPLRRIPAPVTPRTCRWDIITSGPVTPLSPMPIGNSFSGGGFWNRSTPQVELYETSTPVMATEPMSPIVPKDAEAREIYDKVKNEVNSSARRYCLARHNARSSGENDFVPATMIKPRDVMEAAQLVLHSRSVKLEEAIVKDLPERLQYRAVDETVLRRQLSIGDELDISEQNDWMNNETLMPIPEVLDFDEHKDYVPPPVHLAVSILDEQREALRVFRKQRESGSLELSDMALEAAWAVRILEDAERLVASEADGSNNGSDDDDGYSYGNFLRSIRSEMSTSTSSGPFASMVDELSNSDLSSLRSRSNTYQTVGSVTRREFRFPQRSNTSPTKENRWSTRLSERSGSNSSHKHSISIHRRPGLCIATKTNDEIPSGELSPEDREFRHRGPDLADLNHWADELKKMEAMRADRQRSPAFHRRLPTRDNRLSGSTHQRVATKPMSVDNTNTHTCLTKQLHSRFSSSSSSTDTNLLKPLSRPSFSNQSPSASFSVTRDDSRPTMLDHEYHQHKMSKASTQMYQRDTSKASVHDSLHPNQHLRSASSVSVLAKSTTKAEEDEWMGELTRMENRERIRQRHERRQASQLLQGGGQSGRDCSEHGDV